MGLCKRYWAVAVLIGAIGTAVTALDFDPDNPWFFVGLSLVLLAGTCANTGYVARRTGRLDEEFSAGYRVGERAGRRISRPVVVELDERRNLRRAASDTE